MTDTNTTTGMPLEQFNPTGLLMDENVRKDAAATVDDQFTASIRASKGNVIPVLLKRTGDGRLRVFDGARRTIACDRTGQQVNAIVVGDEGDTQADRRARIIGQLIADERLSLPASDRHAAVLTLFEAEGMTAASIAKATGRDKQEINDTLTVARSQTASKAADRWDWLTLPQAAVLAEFDGDQGALTALAKTAQTDPAQFDHVAQQLRDSATERAQKTAVTEQLQAAGYTTVHEGFVSTAKLLVNLRTPEGEEITAEQHAGCPGRAIRIVQEWGWLTPAHETAFEAKYRAGNGLPDDEDLDGEEIEFSSAEEADAAGWCLQWQPDREVCDDPDGNGHVYVYARQPVKARTAEQEAEAAEKASAERRRVIAGNKEWRAARTVRQEWLRAFLTRRGLPKQPKGLARVTGRAVAAGDSQLQHSMQNGHKLAVSLLAADHHGVEALIDAAATDGKAAVLDLGVTLCAWEEHLDDGTWRFEHGSRFRPDAATRYLLLAESLGHTLSVIERTVAYPEKPTRAGSPVPGVPVTELPPDPAEGAERADVAPPVGEIDTGTGLSNVVCTDPAPESCADAGCPVHGGTETEDPPVEDYDPGDEADDVGGMSEHRHLTEDEEPYRAGGELPGE